MLAFDRALASRDCLAIDRASARHFDVDGRMHVEKCRISKANVCPYYGREIPDYQGLGLDANRIYMLYRDPEELAKAAPTFRNLQLLMLHTPVNAVDAKTQVTVGTVGTSISFDGTYLVSDVLTVWTQSGIDLVESKEAAELSCSYRYVADMTPGRSPEGVAYDGVMRDIKGNHVALAREGRVGHDVYVNDAHPLEPKMFKRPNLLARLVSLGVVTAPTNDEARVALDSKLAEITANDMTPYHEDEDTEDDPENPGKKRKKVKPMATDAMIDAAIRSKGYVTSTEAQAMALDAAGKAANEAVARVNALHAAREAVKPLVGVVALDSADAVYRFALEKEGVALDGVHVSAFPALVAQRVALKTAAAAGTPRIPVIAADAASAAAAALPGIGRIQVA